MKRAPGQVVPNWTIVDRLVDFVDPVRGKERRRARLASAFYEADREIPRLRKDRSRKTPPNTTVQRGAVGLRDQVRVMQMNNDFVRGIIRTLVNNTVGPEGIGVEPMPRRLDGSIHEEFAKLIRTMYRRWTPVCEVTGSRSFPEEQRLVAASRFRDGEVFTQMLMGPVPGLVHGSKVPFSLEALDADMVPMDLDDRDKRIRQGCEVNAWMRIVAYHVYLEHPGDATTLSKSFGETKRIRADKMLHLRAVDRIGQLRGVTEFASVINRIADIADYEESERIAAKIAASLTAYIRKGDGSVYDSPQNTSDISSDDQLINRREMEFAPGMVFDGLVAGEEVGMIDTKRPNPNVVTFRQGQLKAVAAGVGVSYSSTSNDYDGTFSSQRQELVEQWVHYAVLTDDFVSGYVAPVYRNLVAMALASGQLVAPPDVDPLSVDDALYTAQEMPWIDPMKEAAAFLALTRAGFASEVEVIRKRGVNPDELLDQMESWRAKTAAKNLILDSNPAHDLNEMIAAGDAQEAADRKK